MSIMTPDFEIIDITPENEREYDLFCKKSKRKEEGYQSKLSWFKQRYEEGLRMKILRVNERGKMTTRGFIEYIPGDYAWRTVNAAGYMFIHCLWVVGQHKKKGYGKKLLDLCIQDARSQGMSGVAMVTNERPWLTGKGFLVKNEFEVVDTALQDYELVVMKFKEVPNPSFPTDWEKRQKKYSKGLTVFYADQCPYMLDAVNSVLNTAEEIGIPAAAIHLMSAKDVQKKAPSVFGVFSILYNGELYRHHYVSKKELVKHLQS